MTQSHKDLLITLAVITGGLLAFFAFLALFGGGDPDGRKLALYEWVAGGVLLGPGFGLLLKWGGALRR